MEKGSGLLLILVPMLVLAVVLAGCLGNESSAGNVTTVMTTTPNAKFVTGDIIAKTATSADTLMLILNYDAAKDQYERAFVYKKPDGSFYRLDEKTDFPARSMIEKLYPARVSHVSSLSFVPVVAPTTATTVSVTTLITTTTTSHPAPAVSSITPDSGLAGTTITITGITGTNFLPGASVRLVNRTTTLTIWGTSTIAQSASNVTCLISIPSTAMAGPWDVIVTNPDDRYGMLNDSFMITNMTVTTTATTATTTTTAGPAPVVLSVSELSGIVGGTRGSVWAGAVAGSYFQTGASIKLARTGYSDINGTNVNVYSGSQMGCSFNLPSDAKKGPWNVVVTNPDGQSGTLADAFIIYIPGPAVTSVSPATAMNGSTVFVSDLAGSGFLNGATVTLKRTGYFEVDATNVSIVSPSKITCTLAVPSSPHSPYGDIRGTWTIIVLNSVTYSNPSNPVSFTIT
jgi:hypothetical protein